MTAPLLSAAANAYLDRNASRAHVVDPRVTLATITYIRDARESA